MPSLEDEQANKADEKLASCLTTATTTTATTATTKEHAMIYMNNAGTSWPKPDTVYQAVQDFYQLPPTEWNAVFDGCLDKVCRFFHISTNDDDNKRNCFLFTTSCTSALALALESIPWQKGDTLITSSMEHEALSRWTVRLQTLHQIHLVAIPRDDDQVKEDYHDDHGDDNGGLSWTTSRSKPLNLRILKETLQSLQRERDEQRRQQQQQQKDSLSLSPSSCCVVAMTMASNVTGEILPYETVLQLCQRYGVICILDGAQLAGLVDINLTKLNPDAFCFAGHKGTLGPQGIGGLYLNSALHLDSLTNERKQPTSCHKAVCAYVPPGQRQQQQAPSFVMPTYCDAGSVNMAAMVGLVAGMDYLLQQPWEHWSKQRHMLVSRLRTGLNAIPGITIVGGAAANDFNSKHNNNNHHSDKRDEIPMQPLLQFTGAVSICCCCSTTTQDKEADAAGLLLSQLALLLKQEDGDYNICASHGLQCAPMAHEALGTITMGGTLRFSVGVFTSMEQVERLLQAIQHCCSSVLLQ